MLQGVSELRWISILVYVDYLINLSKATQGDGIGTLTWRQFHLHLHWWEVQPGHLEGPEIIRVSYMCLHTSLTHTVAGFCL